MYAVDAPSVAGRPRLRRLLGAIMPPAAAAAKRRRTVSATGGATDADWPLSAEELQRYEATGWLHLRGAFSAATADRCRELMWRQLDERCGLRRDAPETWCDDSRHVGSNGLNTLSADPAFGDVGSARLMAALRQLDRGDAEFVESQPSSSLPSPPKSWGSFLITFPRRILGSPHLQPASWRLPRDGVGTGWHWDGCPAAWLDRPSKGVKVFTLFSDVAPRGGGTLLLEGSHRLLDAFFRTLPEAERAGLKQKPLKKRFNALHPWVAGLTTFAAATDGASGAAAVQAAEEQQRISEYMERGTTIDGVPLRVVECCGEAGDAFLVDPTMYHSSSPNSAAVPRFMRSTHVTNLQCSDGE